MFLHSPFEQFDIINLNSIFHDSFFILMFTNSTLFVLFAMLIILFLYIVVMKNSLIFPNKWQTFSEEIYSLVLGLVKDNIGKQGYKYYPLIFLIFTLILFCNLMGMIPYSFTVTSHVIVTCSLGVSLWIGITILGLYIHRLNFFSMFFPSDIPVALAPLLVMIELATYFSRALSLPIRLFANMMSGHALLKILAGFVWVMLFSKSFLLTIGAIIPFAFIVVITGLELGIACLQAYVFAVLVCIYINDSINLH